MKCEVKEEIGAESIQFFRINVKDVEIKKACVTSTASREVNKTILSIMEKGTTRNHY